MPASTSSSTPTDFRSKLTGAWLAECGTTGRCVASRLSKVLTAAGWNVSTYSAGSGVVQLNGASSSDVMYMLKSLGHSDRDVAKALYPLPNTPPSTALTVSLEDIMPYFLRKMQGIKAVPNTLLARSVLGAGLSGFHTLPPPHAPLGKASDHGTAPPIKQLLEFTFCPPSLPPRPPTAFSQRVRASTHGASSDPHTSAASVLEGKDQNGISSGDTGYLDVRGLRRSTPGGGELRRVDTKSSALLRSTRALTSVSVGGVGGGGAESARSGGGGGGGGGGARIGGGGQLLSTKEAAVVVAAVGVEKAAVAESARAAAALAAATLGGGGGGGGGGGSGGAGAARGGAFSTTASVLLGGGKSARDAFLDTSTRTTLRPASARTASQGAALFQHTKARTNLDGRPGTAHYSYGGAQQQQQQQQQNR